MEVLFSFALYYILAGGFILFCSISAAVSKRKKDKASAEAEAKRLKEQREAEEKRRAEEQRLIAEGTALLSTIEPDIVAAASRLTTTLAFDSGYLMKRDWDRLISELKPLSRQIKSIPEKVLSNSLLRADAQYVSDCVSDAKLRERRNEQYKQKELSLCNQLFSNIDGGHSLDPQQREAIVTDEWSNLVIAGAGSGKTSVVVGKVKYLVERWGVKPEEILVTSFTRASVNDLESRIIANGVEGVSARTFHSLGLKALGNNFATAEENALPKFVISYLSDELCRHQDQAAAFLEFFGLQCLADDGTLDESEAEVRMKLLKARDMRTLKGYIQESKHDNGHSTLHGEEVKSIEELMIANFLFLNGIEYEYEKPYSKPIPEELRNEDKRAYQPDFYLSEYDIWLEHFGIDEHGRCPWIKTPVKEQQYIDKMDWARRVHAACETKLIESYSWWNKDQDLLNRLEALLVESGVTMKNDPERNASYCTALMRDKRFFASMADLLSTFISLAKSSNTPMLEIDEKAREAYRGNGSMWHRYQLFSTFAAPIMQGYRDYLNSGDIPKIDFDDMINMAASHIRENGYRESYSYIIVDEYQDISLSRFGLLSAIREATGAKLMCVGDDWQAIYRFAGSDVTLFTNFGKLVGFHEQMRIEHTYRNSQQLVDVASKFILKNSCQLSKKVVSNKPDPAAAAVSVISLDDQQEALSYALLDFLSQEGGAGEIKILGRNKRDLEKIFPDLKPAGKFSFRQPNRSNPEEDKLDQVVIFSPSEAVEPIEIGYMTVHKSKGLQADNVAVVGLFNERYGFPNMVVDDPILDLLLADSDDYDFAEERRLFYVALTRTKNRVWLVTGTDSSKFGKSLFVDELVEDNSSIVPFFCRTDEQDAAVCPVCGGTLLARTGSDGREFVGCSNYPYCEESYNDVRILKDRKKCPDCGGWLTRRVNSKNGEEFFGCTNWPNYCYFTMSLNGVRTNTPKKEQNYKRPTNSTYTYAAQSLNGQGDYNPNSGAKSSDKALPPNKNHAKPHSRKNTANDNSNNGPRCPKCGSRMVIKPGKYGKFYSCTKWPNCDGSRSL